jgi:cytokinin dehydrogenase
MMVNPRAAGLETDDNVPPPSVDSPPDWLLSTAGSTRAAAARDFGGTVSLEPRAVARPRSSGDVAAVVRHARELGVSVAARGAGHSTNGQAQVDDGIVIEMRALRHVHDVRSDRVVVEAGATWSEVLDATLPMGLTPPVLTDYLGLSVGGTLSVGGIGGTSYRYGAQVDNVLELEVVTGNGAIRTCSAVREPALFYAVLAGLGQCGVITRATLRLTPAALRARRYKLYYRSLGALMRDQRRLLAAGRFDYLEGQAQHDDNGGWRFLLEAASFIRAGGRPDEDLLGDLDFERGTEEVEELSYRDFLDRLAPAEAYLRSVGEWERGGDLRGQVGGPSGGSGAAGGVAG